MRTIRWGIVGCGDVTELKSGPAFRKARNSALVAVMRRNGSLARDYAERHGVARWYDSARALVSDPEVDAVYVATPPAFHKEYTLLAAAAGKPVYVEKPMALNEGECQVMIQACREAGVPLFVAYYRRALPRFLGIKDLVDGGRLGEVRCVNVRLHQPPPAAWGHGAMPWRLDPEIAGGGLFADLACHTLDFLDYVLGPIADVCGVALSQTRQYPAEDAVAGTFEFENGIVGAGTWCFSSFEKVDRTEIVGTRGTAVFSTFGIEPVRVETAAGIHELTAETPQHIQQPLIQSIVDELNGLGRCPSRPESALRTTKVMDALLSSYHRRAPRPAANESRS
jgi:predicted dehydrogenase